MLLRANGRLRTTAIVATAIGLTLAFASCAPSENLSDDNASDSVGSNDTVKVGFLSPVTGNVAAAGKEMREGWELFWEEHGSSVGDVKVETIFEDDAGNPETALTKAKRLVEDEHVDVMVGPLLANTALAVSDFVTRQGVPSLQPVTAADDLTQRKQNPLVLRVGSYTGSQMNFPGGKWAYDQGHRTAVTFCPDYAFGWESCGGFVKAFVAEGGKIANQLWYPLGTQDFSTYINQVKNTDADIAFFASAGGADGPRIIKTFNDFGLRDQVELLTNCCLVDQSTLRAVGDAALGVKSVSYWAEGRDSEVVQNFVKRYEEKHGNIPSLNVAGAYMTASVFAEALAKTKGVIDGEAFVNTARQIELPDSLYGPVTFDDMNNPVGPVYIRHVDKRSDGKLWNVVDETFDQVSQFWTVEKEQYLKDPAFSRSNTGQ